MHFHKTGILLCMTIIGCATSRQEMFSPNRKTEVVAHRGASAYAPENTLAAFRLAAEMEAELFELDCTLTADDSVVVIHDATVDRTTDGTGHVAEMTLEQIKSLDAGSWKGSHFANERIPTLGEALDLAKTLSIGVYIEVKDSDQHTDLLEQLEDMLKDKTSLDKSTSERVMQAVQNSGTRNLRLTQLVLKEIQKHRMGKQVVIQSFSPVICFIAKFEVPKLRVELLGAPRDAVEWENYLRWGLLLRVDGLNPHHETLNPTRLSLIHACSKTVAVWTVDEEQHMQKYLLWGVDRIITNRPDVAQKLLLNR